MVEKTDGGKNEESDESDITISVWLASLGKYPTDPANYRDININAAVRAEIVRWPLPA
jgi:hypothetical protein